MSSGSTINYVFASVFVLLGLFMIVLGAAVLVAIPKNQTEWIIALFALAAGGFLWLGAWQTVKNARQKQDAEYIETKRLSKRFAPAKTNSELKSSAQVLVDDSAKHEKDAPVILCRWLYPRAEWSLILKKLAEKTRKEEMYTVVWFPVIFAFVFWSLWYVGFAIGCLFALFYMWFRLNYVKRNFAIKPGKKEAEVIITDAYLRVNGNYIHYADGRYFLKNLHKKTDTELGYHLHFVIGWYTSKGLPAEMDLYLPVPVDKTEEAESVLQAYSSR